jgi:hypothetical protein
VAKKFLTPIDLNKLELQNVAAQNLSSDPGSPVAGQIYYNTTNHVFSFYNGTSFISLGTLDQITAPAADVSLNSHKITSLSNGTGANDAINKGQLDAATLGNSWKTTVRAATTATGTLGSAYANGSVIDGVTLATGDRILIKNQSSGGENGIYVVAASGAPTRATDADSAAEILQAAVSVQEGTANADTSWQNTTNAPITLGTTATVWTNLPGLTSAGTGLSLSGSTLSIDTSITVDKTTAQTLTNKTLTSPALTTPTGIVATDIASGTFAIGRIPTGTTGTTVPLGGVITGAGPTGDASHTLALTYNAAGQITAVTNNAIVIAESAVTNLTSDLAAKVGKYSVDVGTGAATSIVVTHSLSTLDVIVEVYDKTTPFAKVECDVQHTSTSTVTLVFSVAPTSAQYRCTVLG